MKSGQGSSSQPPSKCVKAHAHCPGAHLFLRSSTFCAVLVISCALFQCRVSAQAPHLLWTTNIGARVFSVDEQTNVYAIALGTIFILDGAGAVLQTNLVGIPELQSTLNYNPGRMAQLDR